MFAKCVALGLIILVSLIAVFVSKSMSSEDWLVTTMFFEIDLRPKEQKKANHTKNIPRACEVEFQSSEGLEAHFCKDESATYTWQRQGEKIQVVVKPI